MERQNSLSKITPPGTYHDYYLYKNHSKRLGFLLDNPIFSDVTIIIEKDDSIKKFMCHKAILASHSEPFRAMFMSGMKESISNEVTITDIDPDVFEKVLRYIYSGVISLSISNLSEVLEILFVANKYQIKDLQSVCVNHIHQKINKNNVCTLLETAKMLGIEELQKSAMEYIELNTKSVIQTQNFLLLSKASLQEILQSNQLEVAELELFMAVIEWGKYQIKRLRKDKSGIQQDNLKEMIKDIIPFIRFPLMTPDELYDKVEPLQVVPDNLLHEAYRYHSLSHRVSINFESPRTIKRRAQDVDGTRQIKFDPNLCHSDLTISYDLLQLRKNINDRRWASCLCNKGVSKGRHYWRFVIDQTTTGHIMIGIAHKDAELANFHSTSNSKKNLMFYCWNGRKYRGTSHTQYGMQCMEKDVIGVLLDMDNSELSFYRNGVSQGVAFKGDDLDADEYYPIVALFDINDQVSILPPTSPPE